MPAAPDGSARWRIADQRAIRIIEPFYDALATGLPVGDALRSAKLAALRAGAPAREWAAFTVVGDPLVRIPLRRPAGSWAAWIASGFGAAALAGAISHILRGVVERRRDTVGSRRR